MYLFAFLERSKAGYPKKVVTKLQLTGLHWKDLDGGTGNDSPVNLGAMSVAGPFSG